MSLESRKVRDERYRKFQELMDSLKESTSEFNDANEAAMGRDAIFHASLQLYLMGDLTLEQAMVYACFQQWKAKEAYIRKCVELMESRPVYVLNGK